MPHSHMSVCGWVQLLFESAEQEDAAVPVTLTFEGFVGAIFELKLYSIRRLVARARRELLQLYWSSGWDGCRDAGDLFAV